MATLRSRASFLRSHLWVPLILAAILLVGLALLDGDLRLAQTFFFDTATQSWSGAQSFWATDLLHRGGRNLMRLVGVLAIVGWAASYRSTSLAPHRRALGYLALCMTIVPLTVGALKETTNVDCPWSLQGLGGDRPVIHWYQDRPDELPRAACFPGAHSSSAFALFALYFLWLGSHPTRARMALVGVFALGGLFSIAQQSRGAHFISHDLTSALIAWLICLLLYMKVIRRA
jgi:membrane-associated PAP2 superfamily phosphatase